MTIPCPNVRHEKLATRYPGSKYIKIHRQWITFGYCGLDVLIKNLLQGTGIRRRAASSGTTWLVLFHCFDCWGFSDKRKWSYYANWCSQGNILLSKLHQDLTVEPQCCHPPLQVSNLLPCIPLILCVFCGGCHVSLALVHQSGIILVKELDACFEWSYSLLELVV